MGQWVEARKVKGLFPAQAMPVPAPIPSLPDDLAWLESASQSSTTHSPAVTPTPGRVSSSTKAAVAAARRKSNAIQIWKMVGCVAAVVVGIMILSAIDSFFSKDQQSPPQAASTSAAPPTSSGDGKPSESDWKDVGTLRSMGQGFYDNLPFAKVAEGEEANDIIFTETFCPSGEAKYRRIEHANIWWNDPVIASGIKVEDKVSEGSETAEYFVTSSEPRYVCLSRNVYDLPDLPRLKIGAKPGDTWRYEWGVTRTGEQPISIFTYVRAVRFRGHECAFIVEQERQAQLADGRVLYLDRKERWYVKGIGLVQEEWYVTNFGA